MPSESQVALLGNRSASSWSLDLLEEPAWRLSWQWFPARTFCLRPRPRFLHLPGQEGAEATPEGLSNRAPARRWERPDALPRQQICLRRLLAEAAVLPQHAGPENPSLDPRGRPQHGQRHRQTDAYIVSRRERKTVEMLFAHLKPILPLDRLRLRGPNGAATSSSSQQQQPGTSGSSPSSYPTDRRWGPREGNGPAGKSQFANASLAHRPVKRCRRTAVAIGSRSMTGLGRV